MKVIILEAVVRRCSVKKLFLEISQNLQETTRDRVFFTKLQAFLEISQNSQENTCTSNFIKKETLTQVFSCEFCKISKNTFLLQSAFGGCFCHI